MNSVPELRFLQRLALAAASTLDFSALVELVISQTTEACDTDVCSIYLLQPGGERLLLTATNGLSQTGVGRVSLAVGEGVTGHAAATRGPVVVPDVRDDLRFRWLDGVDQERFVSMCSVPIISADRLVGVLNVQTDSPRRFSQAEVDLLSAIATQVGGMLERSELQARLSAQVEALRVSNEIQRRFGELALSGAGLPALCEGVARFAGAAVVVYDHEGNPLAAGGPPSPVAPLVPPEPRHGDPTVVAIQAASDLLGWLSVREGDEVGGPSRAYAIEHGRTVVALELLRARAADEAEFRLRRVRQSLRRG